jgi:hypothetical protein
MYSKEGKSFSIINKKRIATQRITGIDERLRLVAMITPPNSYFADSTNSIFLNSEDDYNLEYILGLINSKLYQWRFKKTSTNNNVSTTEISLLPFKFNYEIANAISNLVEKILSLKSENPQADTQVIEDEIDELVFGLYGLSEEERAVVLGR